MGNFSCSAEASFRDTKTGRKLWNTEKTSSYQKLCATTNCPYEKFVHQNHCPKPILLKAITACFGTFSPNYAKPKNSSATEKA
jgi:hypothetical protein